MTSQAFAFDNPYPFYSHQRESTPVYRNDLGVWHLTRYQDVCLLLSDSRCRRESPISMGYVHANQVMTKMDKIISKWSLFNDPPAHTHLREMLGNLIHPRFIKNLRETIETIAKNLVLDLPRNTDFDFMQSFAYRLPIYVINHLLNTSLSVETVRSWSFAIATAMDHGSEDELNAIAPTIDSLYDTIQQLVIEREANLGDDWISELIRLREAYQLSIDDIISNTIFLLLAAHETMQLTLGLGLITLVKQPEQRQLLQNSPQLIPSAVEEILRYDSPWTKLSRWTHEPIAFGETIIPANQLVVGLINAANRDPARFTEPDKFDITRTNNRHLAFGHGIHLCHGALLARLELQIAFAALLPLIPVITLREDEFQWAPNSSLRYISNLIIRINSHE